MNILDSVIFYTNDIQSVTEFYTEQIGLKLDERTGDKYVSFLFDNGVKLGIKKSVEKREIPGAQTFFMAIDDATAEYAKAKSKGLNFLKELVEEAWAFEFSILDPDGNKIEFVQNK